MTTGDPTGSSMWGSTTTSVPLPAGRPGTRVTFRRYAGLDDIPGMAAASVALRGHLGRFEPIDVDGMRHAYTHLVNSVPTLDCLLVEVDGVIAGYVRVEWHDLVDGDRVFDHGVTVEPKAWGLGVLDACIEWAEARSLEIAPTVPGDRRSWLQEYQLDGDEEHRAAIERRGYQAVRLDATMRRPHMEHIPALEVPAGFTLRAPEPHELPAVQAMVVAWDGDRPASAICGMLDVQPDGSLAGQLDSLATHPGYRRLGLARACMVRSLELLRAGGATLAYLWVDTDNQSGALALYESCGFRVETTSTTFRKPMDPVEATA